VKLTGNYYTFRNIPYTEPPLGELRFRYPIPRVTVNRTVDVGSNPRICPEASGPWFQQFIPLVIGTIAQACNNTSGGPPGPPPSSGSPESEDCLLLDVTVPKTVWDNRASTKRPVLVWIHGGGYIEGSKESANPPELITKSLKDGKGGMVFASINYRL
jgi:carboxylesterase type B